MTHAALATLTRPTDPLKSDDSSGRPRADTKYAGMRKKVCFLSDLTTVRVGGCLCVLLIPLARSFFPEASFTTTPLEGEASVVTSPFSCCVQSSHCIIIPPALTVATANAHLRTELLCMQG